MHGLWLHSRSTSLEWEYLHLILISPVPPHSIMMIGPRWGWRVEVDLRIMLLEPPATRALAK